MKKVKVAIIGAGNRGMRTYGKYLSNIEDICEIVSVVEPKENRRNLFMNKYNIDKKFVFKDIKDFFDGDKIADAIIISTNDDRHYEPTKLALEKGYHVLLEKPMANTLDKIINIEKLCNEYKDRVFMVSHVLRYTPFFNKLKEIIDSGELGSLITIQHNENIGYWHFAHSYTRGNWRNSSDTSPLILAKSCHDLDILLYLTKSKCKKISSFGSLSHLNNKNFKEEMGDNCLDCKVEESCPYSAKKIYLENERNMNYALHLNPTKENLLDILSSSPYGRCVYKCDNNVVDNMVTIIEFENKVTSTFNLSAFTKECDRTIKLMFSSGEVGGSLMNNEIKIKKFGMNKEIIINPCDDIKGHGGGDERLIRDFINAVYKNDNSLVKSMAIDSIESHIVAFASEYSRISEEVVHIKEFYSDAVDFTNELEEKLT